MNRAVIGVLIVIVTAIGYNVAIYGLFNEISTLKHEIASLKNECHPMGIKQKKD